MENTSSRIPHVAVVILSWNGRKYLEQFLPSVVENTPATCSVYVADNNSSDDSVVFVQDNFPTVRVINIPKNEGFATGYNQALRRVEADYYVLLNQDVEVTPAWLQPMLRMIEKDKTVAAVQPKVRAFNNKDCFEYAGAAGGYMDKLGYTFCRGRLFNILERDEGQYDTAAEVFWATGACMMVGAQLFHQFGGLDDDFFAHMEEIELCWRLKNAGYRIMYTPDSTVYHVGGGSLPQGDPRKTYLNFRNNLLMMIKNLSSSIFWRTFLLRFLLDIIAAYRSLLAGNLADYWAIARAHWYVFTKFGFWRKRRKQNWSVIKKNAIASPNLVGIYNGSIVWQHFRKGKKRFSELKPAHFNYHEQVF